MILMVEHHNPQPSTLPEPPAGQPSDTTAALPLSPMGMLLTGCAFAMAPVVLIDLVQRNGWLDLVLLLVWVAAAGFVLMTVTAALAATSSLTAQQRRLRELEQSLVSAGRDLEQLGAPQDPS